MRLIWLSVAPWSPTGYGLVTRELVPRIVKEGHEVKIACKHFHTGTVNWNGIDVIQGMEVPILNRMIDKGEADYIITLLDNHALQDVPKKWISYTPFDTHKIPHSIAKTLAYPLMLIALTKHGQSEIQRIGYECFYTPHGVDTKIFYPDEELRNQGRKILGWEDNFIIGTVGVNYHDDRKNYVNLFKAFKLFHDKHSEARLFMSTTPSDVDGDDYLPKCMDNLGLKDLIKWVNPDEYFMGAIGDKKMANRYRLMDIMCFPTRGEGFGLPLIEAQACGTPVVATGASTCPELCPDQYLIPVKDDEWEWFNKEWRSRVSSQSIYETLELAYSDDRKEKSRLGVEQAKNYDWDFIFDKYWKPLLKEIEGLKTKVQTVPDYKKLYKEFDGRITMGDCKEWCKKNCPYENHLLPSEEENDRPILSRSYPVVPDENGRLWASMDCPLYNWLSLKFKKEVKETWDYLWGFPSVRKSQSIPIEGFVPLDDLRQDFNEDYRWAMQSQYKTLFPDITNYLQGSILEVGCGDGKRVKEFREKGLDVIGIEINPCQIDNKFILKGDAENLPFENKTFDVLYSVDVMEHLDNPLKALEEFFRVSNLVILGITPVEDSSFMQDPTHKVNWDREHWKREVNEYGLIIDVLEPFTLIVRRR